MGEGKHSFVSERGPRSYRYIVPVRVRIPIYAPVLRSIGTYYAYTRAE